MMMGTVLVLGVVEPLPLRGFPGGSVKIRMREDLPVKVTVKSRPGLVRHFYVTKIDGTWRPAHEIGKTQVES